VVGRRDAKPNRAARIGWNLKPYSDILTEKAIKGGIRWRRIEKGRF
jgi:hypothetical protein